PPCNTPVIHSRCSQRFTVYASRDVANSNRCWGDLKAGDRSTLGPGGRKSSKCRGSRPRSQCGRSVQLWLQDTALIVASSRSKSLDLARLDGMLADVGVDQAM